MKVKIKIKQVGVRRLGIDKKIPEQYKIIRALFQQGMMFQFPTRVQLNRCYGLTHSTQFQSSY